jgi:hypothetical protein
MPHVWGAIIHGRKLPLVCFGRRPTHVVNKVKAAAHTIDANVYLVRLLSGPLKDAVAWAKAEGRAPIVLQDGAGLHPVKGLEEERAQTGIVNLEHSGLHFRSGRH